MTMTEQSKAQRLAEYLERDCQMNWPDYDNQMAAAAELRRLDALNAEWFEKTEWVQKTAKPKELGMHRADVLKNRIDALTALNAELVEALKTCEYVNDCGFGHQEYDSIKVSVALAKAKEQT